MMHFGQQIGDSEIFQKRAVWAVGNNAPASAPTAPPVSPEMIQYRETIEDMTPTQLEAEFSLQAREVQKQQQVVMEVVEDLSAQDANIPQGVKNKMILQIAGAMETNANLIISDELKFSLGSHLKPGKGKLEQWGTKISLMAGTLGAMSEGMDENAPIGQRISGMMKWIKILIALVKGETIAAPSSATSNEIALTAPRPEQSIEAPPGSGTRASLENINLTENNANKNDGYLTIMDGSRELKVKHDATEIKDANGADVADSTLANNLKAYLEVKKTQMSGLSNRVGATSPAEQVQLASTIVKAQQIENRTASPADMAMVVNDNWAWILTQSPSIGADNNTRLAALTEDQTGNNMNQVMTRLRGRYEAVRTQEIHLNRAKQNVRTKFDETSAFLISKLASGSEKAEAERTIKNRFEIAVNNARSVQNSNAVYGLAMSVCTSEYANILAMPENGIYASVADKNAVIGKIKQTENFFGTQSQAVPRVAA